MKSFNSNLDLANEAAITKAAAILRQGGLVAFPTETVYGLGADASNPEAVRKIFAAKGRPADHPLIVHIGSIELLPQWADQVPDAAYKLASRFWPGPLTMIMHKQARVPSVVTGGQQTIALRIPDNPVALRLLRAFAGGIAAPSANRFNRISPTRAQHVAAELGDAVDFILDGGSCRVGLESTIIDLTGDLPALLRPGDITQSQLEEVLQMPVTMPLQTAVRAPGMLELHYAPQTPALLYSGKLLHDKIRQLSEQQQRIGVLAHMQRVTADSDIHVIDMPASAQRYAQALYAALRELDAMHLDIILVEQLPDSEDWRAVNDRLAKATLPG